MGVNAGVDEGGLLRSFREKNARWDRLGFTRDDKLRLIEQRIRKDTGGLMDRGLPARLLHEIERGGVPEPADALVEPLSETVPASQAWSEAQLDELRAVFLEMSHGHTRDVSDFSLVPKLTTQGIPVDVIRAMLAHEVAQRRMHAVMRGSRRFWRAHGAIGSVSMDPDWDA